MMGAYQDGLVTEEKITESAVRLLTTRYLLGLFDGSEYDKIPYSVVECKEHIDEALKMARKSCVLLKNDGVLPIDKTKVNTIGVIGRMQTAVQLLLEIIMEHLQNILLFLKESVKKQVTM